MHAWQFEFQDRTNLVAKFDIPRPLLRLANLNWLPSNRFRQFPTVLGSRAFFFEQQFQRHYINMSELSTFNT